MILRELFAQFVILEAIIKGAALGLKDLLLIKPPFLTMKLRGS